MLSDSSHEIRQQADSALSEFLQEIKNSPVRLLTMYLFSFSFEYIQIAILLFWPCFSALVSQLGFTTAIFCFYMFPIV